MFEAHVLHLLRRYLGEYVHGLSTEALRISVWKGDVVLKDLKLKAEALNSLKLPVAVKSGFVGTITLKVPWKSLGKEPVIVLIDRVFVLAYPAPDDRTLKEEDREKLLETKLQQIEEAESATLDARAKSKLGSDLEVVAEGRVCSTDPDERVHFVPLGPNASKVWIDVSKIGDADVWRPNSEVVCVDDAKGTTIAWPNDKLNSN